MRWSWLSNMFFRGDEFVIIKRKFGTVYIDGEPVAPGSEYPGGGKRIEIRESVPGKEITWILFDGKLVADRNILTFVSWDALNENHLVSGQQMYFSRETWAVRLIKGGRASYYDNQEMDTILQAAQEASEMLHLRSRDSRHAEYAAPHWGDIRGFFQDEFRMMSWGQDLTVEGQKGCPRAVCWGALPSEEGPDRRLIPHRDVAETDLDVSYLGWRPVLEFSTIYLRYKGAIGEDIMVQTTGGTMITGKLQEVTEYDLLLSTGHVLSLDKKPSGMSKGSDGLVSVMRDAIRIVRPWDCREEEITTSFTVSFRSGDGSISPIPSPFPF